jgi:hypothetical protein
MNRQLFNTMPYDPQWPQNGQNIDADRFRAQFASLKDLIDAIQTITAAQVDAVNTVPPGDPAAVTLSVAGGTLHFTFDIPQGANGADGINGSSGSDGGEGPPGPEGPQGVPGEVTLQQLDDAIATTSANSNAVATLGMTVSDPPSQGEMQQIADKLDELIHALRR